MGYIKHHSIIVTSHFERDIFKAHAKALILFNELDSTYINTQKIVTPVYEGIVNTQYTFFIVLDGSKEGWSLSDECDKKRKEFVEWLKAEECACDFVEVCFGGDNDFNEIINSRE